MFLPDPPASPATDRLHAAARDDRGYVPNFTRLWSWRADLFDAFVDLRTQLTGHSTLTERDLGIMVCATARALNDSYCALAWGQKLAQTADPATAAAVLRDSRHEGLTARDRALAEWTRKVARDPNGTTPQDVEALRTAGFSDQAIFEATAYVAFRVAFSTVNDALGARPDWQLAAAVPAEVRAAVDFGRPPTVPAG